MGGSIVFARLRQCAPPPNTCFRGPTWVQIPNGISIGSAFSRFCTAHGSPYTLQREANFPFKTVYSYRDLNPHLIRGSWGPPESSTQTASRSVQPCLQGSLIMVALCNRADHYIFALWFLSFFLFSSPNLSGPKWDVYHTSTHGVALVRI